ncbi:MAG: hypothetical protein WBC04_19715 [Candidatus Acidiferrales bacterium]
MALVLCAVLAACGSSGGSSSSNGGGGNPPPTSNATMQRQWEISTSPSSGGSTQVFLEMNLQGGPDVYSTVTNTMTLYYQPNAAFNLPFTTCTNWTFNGQIQGQKITANYASPGSSPGVNDVSLTGTIATTGQSLSGTYTGGTSNSGDGCEPFESGTFHGYPVSPLNGTFTGTLTSSIYGPDLVTVSISQDANFDIIASGTATEAGVTTNLSVSPGSGACAGCSNVIGATLTAVNGVATNVNGSSKFQAVGRFNAAATQITIGTLNLSTGEVNTGTLTKQ